MTPREAVIAFNLTQNVGSATFAKLEAAAGGAVEAWENYEDKHDFRGEAPNLERELSQAERQHVKLVTILDKEYPKSLLALSSHPLCLYVVGDPMVLSKAGVAVVGTRAASSYGRSSAEKIAHGLATEGWTVFSGLAAGIDAAAHRGALAAGDGLTAGVLGGALDCFFPVENRALAHEIIEHGGCVATEFPFGRRPDTKTFPQRNRIVAAISAGVVAVECPSHSGTRITCNFALEMNHPVMVVPGRIDEPSFVGSHELIRDGATLVTNSADVIEALTPMSARAKKANRRVVPEAKPEKKDDDLFAAMPEVKYTVEESIVLRELREEAVTIDSLQLATKLPISKLNSLLVQLRMKGRVKFHPGNRVSL